MQPWFQVVQPYEFIEELGKREELLVADLGDVISGIAHPIYKDPELFVRTTFFTPGLLRLFQRVQNKINSGLGNGVVRLQTHFGGGKTHSLIALYHFLNNHEKLFSFLPNKQFPKEVSVVSITGTHLNPLKGRKIRNYEIKTIWGEIAYQLRGTEGFNLISENDQKRISPGKEALQILFKENNSTVILLDEITEYLAKARGVPVNDSNLATQTLTFIQELTECLTKLPKSILIVSLPDIEYERISSNKTTLIKISQILSRLASSEIPSEPGDLPQIIRSKLIKNLKRPKELSQIVKKFSDYYLLYKNDFPEIAIKPMYQQLMERSYPFHPSVIDLFYNNWQEISTFQGTRSILSLLSQILYDSMSTRSNAPLIMPSDIELKEGKIRDALFHHLPAKFTNVLIQELNFKHSVSQRTEVDSRFEETYQSIVKTIFLASPSYKSEDCGINLQEINFTISKPDLSTAFTAEVFKVLVNSSKYLHINQNKFYYSDQLNFNSKIYQMKSQYKEKASEQIYYEFANNLQNDEVKTIIWPKSNAEVGDTDVLKLVFLPPNLDKTSLKDHWITYIGKKFRLFRNTVLVAVPDEKVIEDMFDILQLKYALQEYLETYEKTDLPNSMLIKTIKERIEEINRRILYLIRRSYLEYHDWNNTYQLPVPKNTDEDIAKSLLIELLKNDIITAEIHPMFIVDKFLCENDIMSLNLLKNQFLKNGRLPKLVSTNILEQTLINGVKEDLFALVRLNQLDDQKFSYFSKVEIKPKEIKFNQLEFITTKPREEIANQLKSKSISKLITQREEKSRETGDTADSTSVPTEMLLEFRNINQDSYSSVQKGILSPLYEKNKDIRVDLSIQIQIPDSMEDEFLISLIKDTTDQLGGTIQKKKTKENLEE